MEELLVVGSGPAGLAVAAETMLRGVRATVLEKGPDVGAAWAGRYDALRFNTSRIHSALPGAPFPRAWGQFLTRDQYVGYLHSYAARHRIPIRAGTEVTRVDPTEGGWRVQTSAGPLHTEQVVVATGGFNRPVHPPWAEHSDFTGRVLHAASYANVTPFAGQDVVVVGAGSTGMEIAHDLARGGAARVSLSFRTPPNILLRVMGGAPSDLPVPIFLHLPSGWVDRMLGTVQRRFVGDLSGYGLPAPTEGVMSSLKRRGAGTAIVDREVIDAIRDGLFGVVPAVEGLEQDGVRLLDGRSVRADTVILATGYDTGLAPLVGHLGVLGGRGMPTESTGAEALPGLRFVGYVYRPGLTGYVGRQARRVAPGIAAHARASRRARDDCPRPASRRPT